ncbi:MFS transporter [Catenulispora sp. NF23]|uniref:MFS transporter n=1 Tax=Catenulispora pinistramenti TaxID=2705254 RepID=UPI001BA538D9|nr:MFS transporter [Catenulispora pinistramenti]MBS2535595.1 MFS transporter [Catenulispora pinistramenti]
MRKEPLGAPFAKLWFAGAASALGVGLATVATPLLIASRTSSPLVISAAQGVAWLPWLLFALPGGVLVDRVDRRKVMIAVDWARVVLMGALAFAISVGHADIAVIYAVLFLINTGEIVFRTAGQAMIPAVVPREGLERTNGWLIGGVTIMQNMIAGPLGAFLFVAAASIPFWANSGTYAVSAILITMIAGSYRVTPKASESESAAAAAAAAAVTVAVAEPGQAGEPGRDAPRPHPLRVVWAEMAEGFVWLVRQRILRTMAVLIGLLNVTLTAAMAILVLLAKDRLHLGSVGYGLLFTVMAAGSILGSAVGDWLIKKVTATWTIRIGLLIEAALHLVLATSLNSYVVGAFLFAFGVHGALWSIVGNSLRQRLTPPDMYGRVASTNLFIAAGGNCVGALLGGVVAAKFGLTAPYWVAFVVAVLVAAGTWRIFNRADVAEAYAAQPAAPQAEPSPV